MVADFLLKIQVLSETIAFKKHKEFKSYSKVEYSTKIQQTTSPKLTSLLKTYL